jgi:hypothetical protein
MYLVCISAERRGGASLPVGQEFALGFSAPFTVQPVCCLHQGGSLAVSWAQALLSFPSLMQKSKGLLEEGR